MVGRRSSITNAKKIAVQLKPQISPVEGEISGRTEGGAWAVTISL